MRALPHKVKGQQSWLCRDQVLAILSRPTNTLETGHGQYGALKILIDMVLVIMDGEQAFESEAFNVPSLKSKVRSQTQRSKFEPRGFPFA